MQRLETTTPTRSYPESQAGKASTSPFLGRLFSDVFQQEILAQDGRKVCITPRGLLAKTSIERRQILCYYPVQVMRGTCPSENCMPIFGTALRRRVFFFQLPRPDDDASVQAQWRRKPVAGHLARRSTSARQANAYLAESIVERPCVGDLYYLPVRAKRAIAAGSEVLIDVPRWDGE
jgi:hypothetical protein